MLYIVSTRVVGCPSGCSSDREGEDEGGGVRQLIFTVETGGGESEENTQPISDSVVICHEYLIH